MRPSLEVAEHAVAASAAAVALGILLSQGPKELVDWLASALPGTQTISRWMQRAFYPAPTSLLPDLKTEQAQSTNAVVHVLPAVGRPKEELMEWLQRMQAAHAKNKSKSEKSGAEGNEVREGEETELATDPALAPSAADGFLPSTSLARQLEVETVGMTASMLHCPDGVGGITSGGTESILMAVKTYRDWARERRPHQTVFELVAPITAHPALDKAAAYFGVTVVHVGVDRHYRADVEAMRAAISPNTILLVASATQFCHCVVDPIEDIGRLARQAGLPLHVDACYGGFMLPWLEKLGVKIPVFDFREPGVTSISADIHKYGWGAKGASVLVFRSPQIRKHMFFAHAEGPGGFFTSPTLTGPRPPEVIAASWMALQALGESGFLALARLVWDTTLQLREGMAAIAPLAVVGEPHMTGFAIHSSDPAFDIFAVADAMEKRGWRMERQSEPLSLHFSIMPHTAPAAPQLLADLRECVAEVRRVGASAGGTSAVYGLVAKVPDKSLVSDFLVFTFNALYAYQRA